MTARDWKHPMATAAIGCFQSHLVTLPIRLPRMEASACRKYKEKPYILILSKIRQGENGSIHLPKVQNGSNSLPKVQKILPLLSFEDKVSYWQRFVDGFDDISLSKPLHEVKGRARREIRTPIYN